MEVKPGVTMNLPEVKIEDLLESGVHFGHNVRRWNPKMQEYIYGVRNNIHIFDLRKYLLYFFWFSLFLFSQKVLMF